MTDTNPRYLLTEYEALLARLSDVLWNNGFNKAAREADAAVERLHNFLAQPQPQGPTDEEIADEARKYLVNEYTLPAEITYLLDPDNPEYEPTIGCFRAVLARWGKKLPTQAKPELERLTDEELIRVYQSAYQPAWERGEHFGCHVDGLRAVLNLAHPVLTPEYNEDYWRRDALESLLHAATSYKLNVYGVEELQIYEDRARAVLARWGK